MAQFDIKIVNGTVIDGTGSTGRRADVGIRDGRIVALGDVDGDADKVIDADGCLVTPGFIDVHTHYDGQVSWDDVLAPSVYHGVTTAVMGSCGVGFAPVHPDDRQKLVDLMEGVEDIPGTALAEGIPWEWETFPEYMDFLDSIPHTIDFAVQVPHDVLRVYVMRDRAIADNPSTEEDIAKMRDIVREALEHGALGFSTGRSDNHRDTAGNTTPASEAKLRELVGIAQAFHGLDHGVLQAVSDFDLADSPKRFEPEFDILEEMVANADGHKFSMSLVQRARATDQWRKVLARIDAAQEKGLDMRVQVAPRGIGVMLGLQASFHPFLGFPTWQKLSHLSVEEQAAEMSKPEVKEQILSETPVKLSGDGSNTPPLADEMIEAIDFVSARVFRFEQGFDYEPPREKSLLAEAIRRDVSALEAIYDAMIEDDGKQLLYFPIFNYHEGDYDELSEMMTHDFAMTGLSDGGAHVGTICDGSFPTYLIKHWTRDRVRGETGKMSVEWAINKLTGEPAEFCGFHDRGTIEVGKRADINVIDYDALDIGHPEIVADLPAGGKRFLQSATGYLATMVNGELVIENDTLTDARPGRLARMNQLDAPAEPLKKSA